MFTFLLLFLLFLHPCITHSLGVRVTSRFLVNGTWWHFALLFVEGFVLMAINDVPGVTGKMGFHH